MACYNYNGKKYTEEELLKELKANEKALGNISGKWRYESNYEDLKLKEGTAPTIENKVSKDSTKINKVSSILDFDINFMDQYDEKEVAAINNEINECG
jgi:hypothetical protein